jgi:4-amino-4-deoxy-L-arabinose transferase-like glycosyltransferase
MRTTADMAAQQDQGRANALPSSLPALTLPERIPAEWAIVVVVFALATGYSLLFRRSILSDRDEGIILQGAQRILEGQVLYRDFFSYFTPSSYYFVALLFRIFGDSMIVARTALAVYGGFFAVLTYLLARRVCARWSALLSAYIVAIVVLPHSFEVLHNWDSTLWAYLTLYCAIWLLQRPHWGWALGMGTCCSLTALSEQSKGAVLLLGLVVGFGILQACRQIDVKRNQVLAVLAGLAWPVAITMGYFAAQHALPQMVRDLVYPFGHYSTANKVPFSYVAWGDEARSAILSGLSPEAAVLLLAAGPYFLVAVLPIIASGILVYSVVQVWKRGRTWAEGWSYDVLVCACSSGLFLSVLATRKDVTHLVFIAPMLFVIFAWLIDGRDLRSRILDSVRPTLAFFVFVVFTLQGVILLARNATAGIRVETRRGVVRVPSRETALSYLMAHTSPGEVIFVYPYLPLYYYLTATSNPTPYEYLQPGLHTTEQYLEVARRITELRPRTVLFEYAFLEETVPTIFPSTPLTVLAARDPVTDYILKEYRPCVTLSAADFARLLFMVRKDSPCPEASGGIPALKSGELEDEDKVPPLNGVRPREPSQDAR